MSDSIRLLYEDEIESYFDPAVVMEGRPAKYKEHFLSLVDRVNRATGRGKAFDFQYFKDETILTLYTFVSIDKISRTPAGKDIWRDILSKAFQNRETISELETLLNHPRKMALETPLPPAEDLKAKIVRWVQSHPHPVKYVRDSFKDSRIEDPTMADVTLTFHENDHEVHDPKAVICFECKFMSDISHETTHHYARNQIARVIDVGWSLYPNRFYFILVTPSTFKNGKSRFYSYKMPDYQGGDLEVLKQDLLIGGGLSDEVLRLISRIIGWVSWEDLTQVIYQFQGTTAEVPFEELALFFRERGLLRHE